MEPKPREKVDVQRIVREMLAAAERERQAAEAKPAAPRPVRPATPPRP